MLFFPRHAVLIASGLLCLATAAGFAQSGRSTTTTRSLTPAGQGSSVPFGPGVRPAIVTPARPAVVTPARPAVITPARPAVITPAKPAVTYPANPAVTYPANPAVVYPGQPVYPVNPGVIVPQRPVVILPQYPAAYIGPEIISITTGPSPASVDPAAQIPAPAAADPATLSGVDAQTRLVAVLGRLQRLSPAAGTSSGGGGDQLNIGLGALTEYLRALPGTSTHTRASGTFLGYCWDGDQWETSSTGTWTRGPQLRQPLLALHEMQPVHWPFDLGNPGHQIASMRLAIALVDYQGSAQRPFPSGERNSDMATALKRDSWPPSGVDNDAPVSEAVPENYASTSGTAFSTALAESTAYLMGPPQASRVLGTAGWTLSTKDLRLIMVRCPRFTTSPTLADLQSTRAKDPAEKPIWVRPFRIEVGSSSPTGASSSSSPTVYQGEIWFVIVSNAAIRSWQTGAATSPTSIGAPLAP